jgi:hypothetical protein
VEAQINEFATDKLAGGSAPAFLHGAKAEASVPLTGAFLNAYEVPVMMKKGDKLLGIVNLDVTGYCLIDGCAFQIDMASAMRLMFRPPGEATPPS